MKVKQYVPSKLADIRRAAGLTQQQLATYAGISQSSLSLYENHTEPPRLTLENLLLHCNDAAKSNGGRHKRWTINNLLED